MTLKLQPNPTFWHTVPLSVAGSDKPAPVDFEFVHKNKDDLEKFVARAHKQEQTDDVLLSDVIKSWKGVDAEYSPSALRDLLSNYPASGLEIFRGYVAALAEARRKN